jgi:hypothetical protein
VSHKAQRDPVSVFAMSDRDKHDKRTMNDRSDQALRDDPPALPGVPLGVLIVGALGWLLSAIAVVAMPWPMPGAQPSIFGALLRRLIVSIPDEDTLSAISRHIVDLLPFVALVLIPIFLVLATGRRQSHNAVRGLAVIGVLGVLYSLSMALYVGGSCAVIGFVIVMTSGLIGSGAWTKGALKTSNVTLSDSPMAVEVSAEATESVEDSGELQLKSEIDPPLNSETGTGDDHDLYSAS